MPAGVSPPETRFDVMSDLCILAGQAVMQVGSSELKSAMRVVLTVLGREVAARSDLLEAELSEERAPRSAAKRRPRAPACTAEFA